MDEIKPVFKGRYDVIVVGGGIAGIAAAVSAAREGAKTLLLEKQSNLGGLATVGLISWYEPICDGEGTQLLHGIAEELIRLSVSLGYDSLPEKWGGTDRSRPLNHRYSTYFPPAVFSLLLDEYVRNNGVELSFDTYATYPVMDVNICTGVITENCDGREYYEAGAVVDATGDAAIMYRAGVPCVNGRNFMSYIAHGFDESDLEKYAETKSIRNLRRWIFNGASMEGHNQPEGIGLLSGTTNAERNEYLRFAKTMLLEKVRRKERWTYELMALPSMPQFRTIRRIVGDTDFTAENGKTYPDSIGVCGDFRVGRWGNHYEMPLSALCRKDHPNLFAAGRIISAPQGDAWEVARVIPTCAFTGEAAGRAAAKCALK